MSVPESAQDETVPPIPYRFDDVVIVTVQDTGYKFVAIVIEVRPETQDQYPQMDAVDYDGTAYKLEFTAEDDLGEPGGWWWVPQNPNDSQNVRRIDVAACAMTPFEIDKAVEEVGWDWVMETL